MKRIEAQKLKRGDRFSFVPAAWHGPSKVISVVASGLDCVKITFDNPRVVNWPGIQYVKRTELVRKLKEA